MWLGAFASAGSLRSELDIPRASLVKLLAASIVGTTLGAILLLRTSNAAFAASIPALLFIATALYIAGPALTRAAQRSRATSTLASPLGICAQFAIAIYGGFFGAAMGILMLALLGILGLHDTRRANALKVFLSAVINGVAVIPFVIARVVSWEPAVAMSVGAIAGGYLGAGVVKRMPATTIRTFVIVVGCVMTAYFAWKTYVVRTR